MRLQHLIIFIIVLLLPLASAQLSLFKQNLPFKSCFDKEKNGDEADIDCGGSCKNLCDIAQSCYVNSDCQSNYCNEYSLCEQSKNPQRFFDSLTGGMNPLVSIFIFLLAVGLVALLFFLLVRLPQKDIILEKKVSKEPVKTELMEDPLEQSIIKLYYSGLKSNQIAQQLQEQGFSNLEIINSFNQLKEKLTALQEKKSNNPIIQ